MNLVKRVARNMRGRDFIVGDIHGHFTRAGAALHDIGFNPNGGDRLFSVGDLVDRGPESITVLEFLDADYVHAVAGNHETMAADWAYGRTDDTKNYAANGGAWMMALDLETQIEVALTLGALPVAIELETEFGVVGIVHADCPFPNWGDFIKSLEDPALANTQMLGSIIEAAQWSRERVTAGDGECIPDVRAVVVGHTPMCQMTSLGNTIFIDTMGWRDHGHFTILDAATLQPVKKPRGN